MNGEEETWGYVNSGGAEEFMVKTVPEISTNGKDITIEAFYW